MVVSFVAFRGAVEGNLGSSNAAAELISRRKRNAGPGDKVGMGKRRMYDDLPHVYPGRIIQSDCARRGRRRSQRRRKEY